MQKQYIFNDITDESVSFNVLISTPNDYDNEKESLPLIVFLHGAGERGDDINLIKLLGIPKLFDKSSPVRAVTLSPQCKSDKVWNSQVYALKHLIDSVVRKYNIDKSRISITGLSMGGFGTWEMATTFPEFFSAIAPLCGGGMSWRAPLIGKTPVWAFHGMCDTIVEPMYSEVMVKAINNVGGNARLSLYPGVGHDVWVNAYEHEPLLQWLIEQKNCYM